MNELYLLRVSVLAAAGFAVFYSVLTAGTALVWRALRRRENSASLLYTLLVAPLALSLAIVFAFILPSYFRFEPSAPDESIAIPLLALAVIGLSILVVGSARASYAWTTTVRRMRAWQRNEAERPAVVVAGLARQRVIVSDAAEQMLSASEMHLVLRHEAHHAARFDNLRRLLLAFSVAPGFRSLELAWKTACELAADRSAVSNRDEAIELASALVKVSRLSAVEAPLATNFATDNAALLERRVQRLLMWTPEAARSRAKIYVCLCFVFSLVMVFAGYSPALRLIHSASEWLIR